MKKHGFSIIEMSIVLVVIGILTALTIKCLSLINIAKYKKELAAISKLEAGLMSYIADSSSLPDYDGYVLDNDTMLSKHYISKDDLLSITQDGYEWIYHQCSITGDYFTVSDTTPAVYTTSGNMICLALREIGTVSVGNMNTSLACMIEISLDDKHILRGKGRSTNASDAGAITDDEYKDCYSVQGTVKYMYRIY